MREVATASAASAITTHARSQLRGKIRGKLFLSLMALTIGVGLIMGSLMGNLRDRNLYIGMISLFLMLLWAVQYALLTVV